MTVFVLTACPLRAATDVGIALAETSAALAKDDAHGADALASAALIDASGAEKSRLLIARSLARAQTGAQDAALADITQAIDMHALPAGEQAQALLQRGLMLDGMNRLTDAVGDYSAAIMLAPHSAPALNNRANAYRRQSRLDDARRDYLASLRAGNPQPEFPYYGLGQVAEAQGDTEAARGYYAKAVTAAPDYTLAAERLTALGGPPDGARDAPDIVKLHPPKGVLAAEVAPMLHPPGATPVTIHLHPPRATPASYSGDPGLRPAIVDEVAGPPAAGLQAQLGAWRSEEEATQGWNRAVRRAQGVLDGYSPLILAVDLPGRGRYYRLRLTAHGGVRGGAGALCAALVAKGLDCIAVR